MEMLLKGTKLKEIAHKSHTATVVTMSLALRERERSNSDLVRTKNALIRAGEKIVESDYKQYWKDLQAAGIGVIVHGRHDKVDRFFWHFSIKKIAQAMIDGKDVMANKMALPKEASEAPAPKQAAPPVKTVIRAAADKAPKLSVVEKEEKVEETTARSVSSNDKIIYIPLRNDFDLEVRVPQNLSKSEVDLITRALSRNAQ